MKTTDIVRIGIARDYSQIPTALPAILQNFRCRVFVEHIIRTEELAAFFSSPGVNAQITVICTHGWGETDEEAVIHWPLIDPVTWNVVEYHMTPTNMGDIVKKGSGTLINVACRSGKEAFAKGFFDAGFDHYIAPTCSSDTWSALQFLTAFFGYLMYEEREYRPRMVGIAEAVDMARRIDDLPDGASCFRCFSRNL